MKSIVEHLDELDRMVANHAATAEIRRQIAYYSVKLRKLRVKNEMC